MVSAIFYGASKRQRVGLNHVQCLFTRRNNLKRHDFLKELAELISFKAKIEASVWCLPRELGQDRDILYVLDYLLLMPVHPARHGDQEELKLGCHG
jgi:hypothetical protein